MEGAWFQGCSTGLSAWGMRKELEDNVVNISRVLRRAKKKKENLSNGFVPWPPLRSWPRFLFFFLSFWTDVLGECPVIRLVIGILFHLEAVDLPDLWTSSMQDVVVATAMWSVYDLLLRSITCTRWRLFLFVSLKLIKSLYLPLILELLYSLPWG